MERYKRFFEGKNAGNFLNGTQSAIKVLNVIKKLLTSNGMSLQTRLGKSGWTVEWNGDVIQIEFSPIYKKDKRGFNTDVPEKGEMDQYDRAFKLIKSVYSSAMKNDNYNRIEIKSEE